MKDSLLGEPRTSGALHFRRLLKESADERRKQQARSVSNSPQNENSWSLQISRQHPVAANRERGGDTGWLGRTSIIDPPNGTELEVNLNQDTKYDED